MGQHNELGKLGEKLAQEYLISKGYVIKHTNWRSGRKELDIVATKDGLLVIVEVKTRSTDFFAWPEDAINLQKIKLTVTAAHNYVLYHGLDIDIRFDVISIVLRNEKLYDLEHFEDAFYPSIW